MLEDLSGTSGQVAPYPFVCKERKCLFPSAAWLSSLGKAVASSHLDIQFGFCLLQPCVVLLVAFSSGSGFWDPGDRHRLQEWWDAGLWETGSSLGWAVVI